MKKHIASILSLSLAATLLGACGAAALNENNTSSVEVVTETVDSTQESGNPASSGSTASSDGSVSSVSQLSAEDQFSDRDLSGEYDASEAVSINLEGSSASCESSAVTTGGSTVTITEEGVYLLSGTLNEGRIVVSADDSAKVQLVLNGVSITNSSTACIYINGSDKTFITLADGSKNTLSVTGTFADTTDDSVDGVIFSRDDLVLNGSGSLEIDSTANGIVGKDDLKLTGGNYQITAAGHGLQGNDSIRIADGSFTISAGKDGIHAKNDEGTGYVYICGGTIEITDSEEGIEGNAVIIDDGTVRLSSTDDGINAAGNTGSSYIEINGGTIFVKASGDGIDSNGALYVNGGETYVSGPTNAGNGALDYDSTGSITGGIFVAVGSSGMAMNFNEASQGSILVNLSGKAGDTVTVTDEDGKTIVTYTAESSFETVLVSAPGLTVGGTYTVTAGSNSSSVTLDEAISGGGFSFGMGGKGWMGEGGMQNGHGGPGNRESFDGSEMPQMPEGGFDGSEMPQMPEGGFDGSERPQMPEGGFDRPEGGREFRE